MPKMIVDWNTITNFVIDAFVGYGVPKDDAVIIADVLLESDKRGIESHGCNRFKPVYLDRIKAGIQNPVTNFEIIKETETTAVVDGHDGMGQVIGYKAMQMAIDKAIEKANYNKVFDGSLDTINGMIEQGVSYSNAMKWATDNAGSSIKTLKALQNAVNICYGRASGAGFKGIPAGEWNAIDVMLRNGDFETEEEYMSYLAQNGADKKQIVDGRQRYKDFTNGTGNYAYEFKELQNIVMGKSNLNDKQKAKWDGAVLATQDEISDFIIKHKRQPSKYEVINMLSENMTKGVKLKYSSNDFWWSNLKATNAELALVGVKTITQQDNNTYIVHYMSGDKVAMNGEEVEKLIDTLKG